MVTAIPQNILCRSSHRLATGCSNPYLTRSSMKPKSFAVARALAVCALIAALAVFALAQDKNKAPQVSKGEQEAMMKVQSAADPAAKIKAAEEFIKKYPKSTNRAG